uniref:MPN domain-containing protein n=1 Tax=Timema tahoe TaxID=61484 RepID=A0A7R9NYD1_9NEOP|nr:unnamed protein product [Timema tahoe]
MENKKNGIFSLPSDLKIMDPSTRLKTLTEYGNAVEVDNNIPPKRYYRSGLEMVRMADVYMKEGNLENAFILYMKFMTLFIEKIRYHPDFSTVPVIDRTTNAQKLREVMPKAEKLKSQLMECYEKEYKRYFDEQKAHEESERARLKRLVEEKRVEEAHRNELALKLRLAAQSPLVVAPQIPTDDVCYDLLDQDKPPAATASPATLPSPSSLSSVPMFDRNMKPINLLTPSLRDVTVPRRLIETFKNLAQRNTDDNIETCGILAGKLSRNVLTITHLVLSKQSGTSDSCITTNEVEVDQFQRDHDLVTIGWIHTHPSQTAFLSSVDLHTHYSYQCLMSEAVAIVCAPTYNEDKIFMLTPDYGLNFIRNCRETGFHPHPTHPPLYTLADHVRVFNEAPCEVIDMR